MMSRLTRTICSLLLTMSVLLTAAGAAADKTVLITFTGDCTIGGQEKTRALPDSFDTTVSEQGYDYFFRNFKSIFTSDDLTVINFEGVFSDSKVNEAAKKYRFRGKTAYAKILTGSGIDAASLSNNHIGD